MYRLFLTLFFFSLPTMMAVGSLGCNEAEKEAPLVAGERGGAEDAGKKRDSDDQGASADSDDDDSPEPRGGKEPSTKDNGFNNPTKDNWPRVPKNSVKDECRLDYETLDREARQRGKAMAVVRYGKLCYVYGDFNKTSFIHSVTKTLGGVTFGAANKLRKDDISDNHEAPDFKDQKMKNVLGMTAHTGGQRFNYDTVGTTQINKLSGYIENAVGISTLAFAQDKVFDVLGFKDSRWVGNAANFATGWVTSLEDMARLGLLIMNHGYWDGKSVMTEEYTYRMIHPQNSANNGYGYLIWLLGEKSWMSVSESIGGSRKLNEQKVKCAPVALTGCNGKSSCSNGDRKYDVGVWYAAGTGGQVISGHPGLDMVIVGKDLGTMGWPGPKYLWDLVRPSVVKLLDKTERQFCNAYGANKYAPDYKKWKFEQ